MRRKYQPSPAPQLLHKGGVHKGVPLAGVPTIPDALAQKMTDRGERSLTPEEQELCSSVIWGEATKEIQRRQAGRKAGVEPGDFFAFAPGQFDDDEDYD